MRKFYLAYKTQPKLRQLVAEIPWGQNLLIMGKIKDDGARLYYLQATKDYAWTRNMLSLQINSNAYERHQLSPKQHNFDATLPKHLAEQADKSMKDIYMFELGLSDMDIE